MSHDNAVDYYELLQISPNAEPETINRVYRLLAQRVHPDNPDTGDAERFRAVHDAYAVLSDPEQRARYDITHHARRHERWRLVSQSFQAAGDGSKALNDFTTDQVIRLTVLELLYARRRMEPRDPGVFDLDLEGLTGQPREHLEFTLWYLIQKKLVQRGDNSRLTITVEGVDYLAENHRASPHRRRLNPASVPPAASVD